MKRRSQKGAVLLLALITLLWAGAAQAADSGGCSGPRYSYSEWTQTGTDRRIDGQWVIERVYLERTRTDTCDGSQDTETRTVGPRLLWPAVPDNRIDAVSGPAGTDTNLSGSSLQSTDSPGQAGTVLAPDNVQFHPRLGPVDEPDVPTPAAPSRRVDSPQRWPDAFLSGLAPHGLPFTLVLIIAGIVGMPMTNLLWREPLLHSGLSALPSPVDWGRRIWDGIAGAWDYVRQNRIVWWTTEVVRRLVLFAFGVVQFVVTTVVAVVKLLGNVASWLASKTIGNARFLWDLATGSATQRRQIITDFNHRWLTGNAWTERWEAVKFGAAMFFAGIVDTWKRLGAGLLRFGTDPDMITRDLIQVGEDAGSAFCDALIVVDGVGAAVRAIRTASWAGKASRLSEFGKLGYASQLAEASRIASELRALGFREASAYRVWRVMSATQREIELEKLLAKIRPEYQNTVAALREAGYLEWNGTKISGTVGTVRPWKLDEFIASGETRRIDNMMNQISGGLGEMVVRTFMMKEVGFQRFLIDFSNPSATGLDALAEYSDSIVGVEVKNLSSTVGVKGVSRFLTVDNGSPKFSVGGMLADIRQRGGRIGRAKAQHAIENGTFVFRIELVGPAATKATADLTALNGKVVDGVKIIVISR